MAYFKITTALTLSVGDSRPPRLQPSRRLAVSSLVIARAGQLDQPSRRVILGGTRSGARRSRSSPSGRAGRPASRAHSGLDARERSGGCRPPSRARSGAAARPPSRARSSRLRLADCRASLAPPPRSVFELDKPRHDRRWPRTPAASNIITASARTTRRLARRHYRRQVTHGSPNRLGVAVRAGRPVVWPAASTPVFVVVTRLQARTAGARGADRRRIRRYTSSSRRKEHDDHQGNSLACLPTSLWLVEDRDVAAGCIVHAPGIASSSRST